MLFASKHVIALQIKKKFLHEHIVRATACNLSIGIGAPMDLQKRLIQRSRLKRVIGLCADISAIQERGDQFKFPTFFLSAGAAGLAGWAFATCERDMTEHILMIFPALHEVRSDFALTWVSGRTTAFILLRLRTTIV